MLEFQKISTVIPESIVSSGSLLKWAAKFQIVGKKLHDLQLLAPADHAGAQMLITSNVTDFPAGIGPRIISLADLEL